MALTFDLTGIVNKPADFYVPLTEESAKFSGGKVGSDVMNWRYEVIIMPGTMLAGIGVLNDDTIPEFYARLNAYERLMGALGRNGDGTEHFTEFEDIVKMKGLRTNVQMMTRTKWVKHFIGVNFLDEQVRFKKRELPKVNDKLLAESLGLDAPS